MSAPQRYLPERPFPPYAYVPGRQPHPVRDPAGHSHGAPEPPAADPLAPDDWRASADFLYGVDLFNHGYYWEAHEAWEGLWRAAPDERARAMLHGLIKLAAAGVKLRAGNLRGVQRHADAAADLFRPLAAEGRDRLYGLDPRALKESADEVAAAAAGEAVAAKSGLETVLRPE